MIRLFQTNAVRTVRELEGMWQFAPLQEGEPLPAHYPYTMPVPGCWEMHPDFRSYRGQAAYRTLVQVERRGAVRLVFKGVSHTASVYWDGKLVAEHYNAYTAFDVTVPDVEPGEHELVVRVDNGFSERSALHRPNDYYTYGGIIRPVAMELVADTYIERIQFTPQGGDGEWAAAIEAVVRNVSDLPAIVCINGRLGHIPVELGSVEVPGGGQVSVKRSLPFPGVGSWSADRPTLYRLALELSMGDSPASPVDDLIERVGFRTVTTNGGRIQVNGRDIVLKGVNRHEDHPLVGAAFPLQLIVQDLDIIADMGCNAVRTSHYPSDERLLDLCDERGLYVWEENHARGIPLEEMRNPYFARQCEDCNREMVEQHANHPSIIIWAILNECASDSLEGRVHYERQLKQIREMDGSRPLTFASHHRANELCFDLADIVSFNLYPGWYTDEDPGELCDLARGWADAAGGAGKPMIMSEFGGDGYYGLRDPLRVRGTEERHADIIEANLAAYCARDYVSGMFIWQYCDIRVTEGTGWLLSRAGTMNSKGIVDKYRRPKLAYEVVQRYFGKLSGKDV